MIGHQALERLARILAAAIGVMQQSIGLTAPRRDRRHQRIGDKLGIIGGSVDHPTTRREKRSITAAT